MFKIALNAGHGLYTAGKRCLKSIDPNETREWKLNSRVCEKIEEKLKAYTGYELLRIDDRTGKTDVKLIDRTNQANKWGADFYLSIHHNAGIAGGPGGGIVAFTYTEVDKQTEDWQRALYNSLIAHTGLKGNRSVPLAKADLHECRETKMPTVLLECGFMDSTHDTPIILTEQYAEQVAAACVEVIVEKGKLFAPKTYTNAVISVTAGIKTIEEVAKEVINGKYGNGVDRMQRLKAEGYDYTEVQTKVNELLNPANKSVDEIAREVIAGKWGNGADRKKRLTEAGYDYAAVQNAVNRLSKK